MKPRGDKDHTTVLAEEEGQEREFEYLQESSFDAAGEKEPQDQGTCKEGSEGLGEAGEMTEVMVGVAVTNLQPFQ